MLGRRAHSTLRNWRCAHRRALSVADARIVLAAYLRMRKIRAREPTARTQLAAPTWLQIFLSVRFVSHCFCLLNPAGDSNLSIDTMVQSKQTSVRAEMRLL